MIPHVLIAGALAAVLVAGAAAAETEAPPTVSAEEAGREGRATLDSLMRDLKENRAEQRAHPPESVEDARRKAEAAEATDRKASERLSSDIPGICIGCR
ncbi:hypothetical protein [Methylobacterium sp. A54F]